MRVHDRYVRMNLHRPFLKVRPSAKGWTELHHIDGAERALNFAMGFVAGAGFALRTDGART